MASLKRLDSRDLFTSVSQVLGFQAGATMTTREAVLKHLPALLWVELRYSSKPSDSGIHIVNH
jgi:hypothetical protein